MTARATTVKVFARREVRQQEQCLAVVSPDGERAFVTCRRRIEVVEVVAVIEEVVCYPDPRVLALAALAPKLRHLPAAERAIPLYREAAL